MVILSFQSNLDIKDTFIITEAKILFKKNDLLIKFVLIIIKALISLIDILEFN